jgi:hypothetical protein
LRTYEHKLGGSVDGLDSLTRRHEETSGFMSDDGREKERLRRRERTPAFEWPKRRGMKWTYL